MDIQDLAKEVLKEFKVGTRENGKQYIYLSDDKVDWMQDLCYDAHDGMLPDDHKYQFIKESLQAIVDYNDLDEARESLEPDFSTSGLTSWLASSNVRLYYCNDAVSDGYISLDNFNTSLLLQAGQLRELTEVFEIVVRSLEDRLNEIE